MAKEITITIGINEKDLQNSCTKREQTEGLNKHEPSQYSRFFDESCPGWTNDAEYNLAYLRTQQLHANALLKSRGYLFLNDLYDILGFPRTKVGALVGWVYDPSNSDIDNFIDFGIYDLRDPNKRKFVNGYKNSILLDFNVDGCIINILR
jgi:hypothetical protein